MGTLITADENLFGFLSMVSLQYHRKTPWVSQLITSLLQRCASPAERETLQKLFTPAADSVGFLISERLVNMPMQLVPVAYDSLLQDIDWAMKNEVDQEERKSFNFKKFILMAEVTMVEGAASAADAKRQKKSKQRQASVLEQVEFVRVEEEVLANEVSLSRDSPNVSHVIFPI